MPGYPPEPLDEPPAGYLDVDDRRAMLDAALRGVALGRWDTRIVDWLYRMTDTATLVSIVGMIERARIAGTDQEDDPPLVTRPHDWPHDQ
jgi:hypothetical protein